MKTNIEELEFEPLNSFMSCGNNIQHCGCTVMKVHILWRTFFPWSIFKDPTDTFILDLILPMGTIVLNGWMDHVYEPEGFGAPHFRKLEDAVEFIESFNEKQHENN